MEVLKEQLVVETDDLLGDILAFKPADIGLTALDTCFASLSASEGLADGCSHTLGIVRRHVEVIRTSGFLKTGSCAGYDGQACADGLDYRNAKTLIE
jgi:hypothetical protein